MMVHRGASHAHPILTYIQQVRRGMGDPVDYSLLEVGPATPDFLPAPTDFGGSGGSSGGGSVPTTDWTKVFTSLITNGTQLAKQIALPSGSYITSQIDPRTGQVMYTQANNVPGAVPGTNVNFGSGGSSSLLLIGGLAIGGLVLVKMMSKS